LDLFHEQWELEAKRSGQEKFHLHGRKVERRMVSFEHQAGAKLSRAAYKRGGREASLEVFL
jgi:RNA-splicing ligase RtcB